MTERTKDDLLDTTPNRYRPDPEGSVYLKRSTNEQVPPSSRLRDGSLNWIIETVGFNNEPYPTVVSIHQGQLKIGSDRLFSRSGVIALRDILDLVLGDE